MEKLYFMLFPISKSLICLRFRQMEFFIKMLMDNMIGIMYLIQIW